jgi:hypothetical protein
LHQPSVRFAARECRGHGKELTTTRRMALAMHSVPTGRALSLTRTSHSHRQWGSGSCDTLRVFGSHSPQYFFAPGSASLKPPPFTRARLKPEPDVRFGGGASNDMLVQQCRVDIAPTAAESHRYRVMHSLASLRLAVSDLCLTHANCRVLPLLSCVWPVAQTRTHCCSLSHLCHT